MTIKDFILYPVNCIISIVNDDGEELCSFGGENRLARYFAFPRKFQLAEINASTSSEGELIIYIDV